MTTQLVHGGVRVAEPSGAPTHPTQCPRASLALPWVPGGSWRSPFPCLGLSFLMSEMGGCSCWSLKCLTIGGGDTRHLHVQEEMPVVWRWLSVPGLSCFPRHHLNPAAGRSSISSVGSAEAGRPPCLPTLSPPSLASPCSGTPDAQRPRGQGDVMGPGNSVTPLCGVTRTCLLPAAAWPPRAHVGGFAFLFSAFDFHWTDRL